jgi:hypothetical protein
VTETWFLNSGQQLMPSEILGKYDFFLNTLCDNTGLVRPYFKTLYISGHSWFTGHSMPASKVEKF